MSEKSGIPPLSRAKFASETVLQLYSELPSDMGLEDVRSAYMTLQKVILRLERDKQEKK